MEGALLAGRVATPITTTRQGLGQSSGDDAWECDDNSVGVVGVAAPSANVTTPPSSQAKWGGSADPGVNSTEKSFPSLQALCLGSLGEVLPELLEVGTDILPLLPSHCKAALLALARRQGLINDGTLAMLVDEEWTTLDLAGCSTVSEVSILSTLYSTPHLRALDVSHCAFSAASLRQLPRLCPQLQVLRLGGCLIASRPVARALGQIVPVIQQPAAASESWEHDVVACEEGVNARLTSLHQIVWPDCPSWLAEQLATVCPKIQVNAYDSSTRPGKEISEAANPGIALDTANFKACRMEALIAVAVEVPMDAAVPEVVPEQISIAERFRLAYAERDQKEAVKAVKVLQQAARNEAQRQRRAARAAGSATHEMKRLLCEDW